MKGSANVLVCKPMELCHVQHLYISNRDPYTHLPPYLHSLHGEEILEAYMCHHFDNSFEEEALRRKIFDDPSLKERAKELSMTRKQAFPSTHLRIMQAVGSNLRTLTLHVGASYPDMLAPERSLTTRYPKTLTLPSLKYLHLIDCSDYCTAFVVPALTHLCLSGISPLPADVLGILRALLPQASRNPKADRHADV
ncbi:hypothetical protein AcV7_002665 [Taiwanofungus camphoratus]|nr:hypothetical protein AcV7_002665 [Antrodia cinnamomea]